MSLDVDKALRRAARLMKNAELDLSRFRAAPSARLGHFPFEGDRAFPAQSVRSLFVSRFCDN